MNIRSSQLWSTQKFESKQHIRRESYSTLSRSHRRRHNTTDGAAVTDTSPDTVRMQPWALPERSPKGFQPTNEALDNANQPQHSQLTGHYWARMHVLGHGCSVQQQARSIPACGQCLHHTKDLRGLVGNLSTAKLGKAVSGTWTRTTVASKWTISTLDKLGDRMGLS